MKSVLFSGKMSNLIIVRKSQLNIFVNHEVHDPLLKFSLLHQCIHFHALFFVFVLLIYRKLPEEPLPEASSWMSRT